MTPCPDSFLYKGCMTECGNQNVALPLLPIIICYYLKVKFLKLLIKEKNSCAYTVQVKQNKIKFALEHDLTQVSRFVS